MAGDTKAQQSARKGQDGAEWWKDYPEAQPDTKEPLRADAAADKPKPSMGRELLRQVGLTARAGINGVASIPAMLSDAVTGPINAGLDLVRGEGNGFRFKKAGASMNDLMTRAGLPEPQNATERVVGDVAAAMAGAGGFVGADKALAQTGGEVAKGVASALAAGPGLQVASAGAGAGSSGVVRENGGGTGAQVAAGVVAAAAGQPLPLMGALAVPAMANAGAKAMTSPAVLEMAATKTAMSPGAGAAMVNAAASVDAQPLPMPAADDRAWWQAAPLVDAGPGLSAAEGPMGGQPVGMPPAQPLAPMQPIDPLDNMPPVGTRDQMQRLSEAATVDEAIAALHEPSPVDVARAQVSQMLTERQRLEAMRERARAARLEAENEMAQARATRIAAERERLATMRERAMNQRLASQGGGG